MSTKWCFGKNDWFIVLFLYPNSHAELWTVIKCLCWGSISLSTTQMAEWQSLNYHDVFCGRGALWRAKRLNYLLVICVTIASSSRGPAVVYVRSTYYSSVYYIYSVKLCGSQQLIKKACCCVLYSVQCILTLLFYESFSKIASIGREGSREKRVTWHTGGPSWQSVRGCKWDLASPHEVPAPSSIIDYWQNHCMRTKKNP